MTRPFCGLWQAWRRRGACCRVQRRRAWQSMSVVTPLSAQLWHLSSQPPHRFLLALDHHFVLIPVLCCTVMCCAVLCYAVLPCGVNHIQLCCFNLTTGLCLCWSMLSSHDLLLSHVLCCVALCCVTLRACILYSHTSTPFAVLQAALPGRLISVHGNKQQQGHSAAESALIR